MQAPGKIILFGEHFVVKGKPALALAVKLYAKSTITVGDDKHILYAKDMDAVVDLDSDNIPEKYKPFKKILEIINEEYGSVKPFKAELSSNIPVAAGMGSSAATAVAFTASLLEYLGVEYERGDVSRIAFEAEKITHGRPSGIDNTVSTYGGFIYYKGGAIERIGIEWPGEYVIVAIDTGIPRNTGEVVRDVLDRYDRFPDVMKPIYDSAEVIVEEAITLLRGGRIREVGELMNINHGLLVAIGVSNKAIEEIRYAMLEEGAYGAKLTGAGRGGIVIGLTPSNYVDRIIYKLMNMGYRRTMKLEPDNNGFAPCPNRGLNSGLSIKTPP